MPLPDLIFELHPSLWLMPSSQMNETLEAEAKAAQFDSGRTSNLRHTQYFTCCNYCRERANYLSGTCALYHRTGHGVMRVKLVDVLPREQLNWHVDRWRSRSLVKEIEGEQKQALSVFLGKERDSGNQARIRKSQFTACFRAAAITCRKARVASSCFLEGAQGSQDCVIVDAGNKSAALGHRLEMTAGKLKGTNKLAA